MKLSVNVSQGQVRAELGGRLNIGDDADAAAVEVDVSIVVESPGASGHAPGVPGAEQINHAARLMAEAVRALRPKLVETVDDAEPRVVTGYELGLLEALVESANEIAARFPERITRVRRDLLGDVADLAPYRFEINGRRPIDEVAVNMCGRDGVLSRWSVKHFRDLVSRIAGESN